MVEGRRGTAKQMSRSGYVKGSVLVVAVLILAVEAFFGYRWYERYYGNPRAAGAAEASAKRGEDASPKSEKGRSENRAGGAGEATVERAEGTESDASPKPEEARSGDQAGGAVVVVHRATPESIVDNSTYVDNPAANGDPNAVVMISRARNPDGTPFDAHPTGVWYDENRGGRWAIFNQDLVPMPEGAVFDVMVLQKPGGDAFVHRVTAANTVGESTYIDHPSTNAAPRAVLSVTPNWNPGGGAGTYDDHPVGVRYDPDEKRWAIRNEDLAPMPAGTAFNVSVRKDGAG